MGLAWWGGGFVAATPSFLREWRGVVVEVSVRTPVRSAPQLGQFGDMAGNEMSVFVFIGQPVARKRWKVEVQVGLARDLGRKRNARGRQIQT